MTGIPAIVTGLERQRPEWAPWLAVVADVLDQAQGSAWTKAVPGAQALSSNAQGGDGAPREVAAPRLAGATIALSRADTQRLLDRLLHKASRSGTPQMATLTKARNADFDVLELFAAAVCHRADRIGQIAATCGVEAAAFEAVAALLPVPFLQACNRSWAAAIPEDWVAPYCPVCGSWPAFAEVRGIERSRYYRCGRCGGEWHAHGLSCPYCETTDHRDLASLVPEGPGASAVIEACTRCLGYVKTFNRLQGCAPLAVVLEDLGGVALDVAALEQGYVRPAGAGYAFAVQVTDTAAKRGFFARA
jgi:FdhE protein